MKKKLLLFLCLVIGMTPIMSGCFFKEMTSEMFASEKDEIIGNWYDADSKAYFVFYEDGTYQSGYGMYADHAGGYYELDGESLFLTIQYTILDGQKEMVNEPDQEVIEMKYRIDLNGRLIIRSDENTVTMEKIDPKSEEDSEDPEMQFQGLYKSSQDNLYLYFDGNSGISRSTGSNDQTYSGSYTIDNQSIIITIDSISQTYAFSFNDQNQLILIDEDNQETKFDKVN